MSDWDDDSFEAVLERLRTEGTIDAYGARITPDQLTRILDSAPQDPQRDGRPLFRTAKFIGATFEEALDDEFTIGRRLSFGGATFQGDAWFDRAIFKGPVQFDDAVFHGAARFTETVFRGWSSFNHVHFRGDVGFWRANFETADLSESTFDRAGEIGPIIAGAVDLGEAVFAQPTRILVDARLFSCLQAQFLRGAEILVRHAEMLLDSADFAGPSILAPLAESGAEGSDERRESEGNAGPVVASLRRAKVADLTIADADLRICRFEGTLGLDQLRLERVHFADTPSGWHRTRQWGLPVRWTSRQAIAEEHQWRAHQAGTTGWNGPEMQPSLFMQERLGSSALASDQVGAIYRALRKGREDIKDEPGAADFYYGEMEMRRQRPRGQHTEARVNDQRPIERNASRRLDGDRFLRPTPRSERLILWCYWLVAGYGLRASRALVAFAATVVLFAFVFDSWGFRPNQGFGRALLFSVESSVSLFRVPASPGFVLTAGGEVFQILLRLLCPLFFGLALLSLRGRVKR